MINRLNMIQQVSWSMHQGIFQISKCHSFSIAWCHTGQTHVSCVKEKCQAQHVWHMNFIAIAWLLWPRQMSHGEVTLGTHVSLSCCSWSQLLCLKLFSKNLGHMLPKFTGVRSRLNQQVFDTSEAAIIIPGHQRCSRVTCMAWLLKYQLRVSSSSTPDLQRLLSRATKSSKIRCDLVGSDKWQDWGHWR